MIFMKLVSCSTQFLSKDPLYEFFTIYFFYSYGAVIDAYVLLTICFRNLYAVGNMPYR